MAKRYHRIHPRRPSRRDRAREHGNREHQRQRTVKRRIDERAREQIQVPRDFRSAANETTRAATASPTTVPANTGRSPCITTLLRTVKCGVRGVRDGQSVVASRVRVETARQESARVSTRQTQVSAPQASGGVS